jgi:DNA-binding NarL/FixJ family response regulator
MTISNGQHPRITILICDDNGPMREVLRDVIELRPSLEVVGEAGDGDEAVVEAMRLQPDVILLDLAMPNRTGLGALVELGQVAPFAKIIVFSSFLAEAVADDVLALGAVRYLEKGASPDEINDAIEEAAAATPAASTERIERR